jgi:hypothetical protein
MQLNPKRILRTLLFLTAALALLAGMLPAAPAAAQQSPVSFESLTVDIWPEYDQPSVLVIMHITVSAQVGLPATVGVRIPAEAGRPHAVAMQDVAGLYNLNYEMLSADAWTELRFTTPVPDVRIEYYDPTLQRDGPRRSFTYRWPGDYLVENFAIRTQQPVNASAMTFRPDLGSGRPGDDGLTYYALLAGRVDAGMDFELSFQYDKPDDLLTSPQQFQPVQPSQPIDSTTAGRVTLDQVLPWALGGLGVLMIAAGLFWYWRTGSSASSKRLQSAPRRHRAKRASGTVSETSPSAPATASAPAPAPAAESDIEPAFCHQCGKRAGSSDLFCRACGTRLR